MFGEENGLLFPIDVSHQKFEDSIDLLLLIDIITLCVHKIF